MVGVGLLALIGEVTIGLLRLLVAGTCFPKGKGGGKVVVPLPELRLGATRVEIPTYLDTVLQTVQLEVG